MTLAARRTLRPRRRPRSASPCRPPRPTHARRARRRLHRGRRSPPRSTCDVMLGDAERVVLEGDEQVLAAHRDRGRGRAPRDPHEAGTASRWNWNSARSTARVTRAAHRRPRHRRLRRHHTRPAITGDALDVSIAGSGDVQPSRRQGRGPHREHRGLGRHAGRRARRAAREGHDRRLGRRASCGARQALAVKRRGLGRRALLRRPDGRRRPSWARAACGALGAAPA